MRRAAVGFAAFMLCVPPTPADGPPSSRADQPTTPLPSDIKERIDVRLVTVDVVALDAADATVPNMRKRDFKLIVDGIPTMVDTLDVYCNSGAEPDPKSRKLGEWQASPDLSEGTRRVVLAFDYLHLPTAVCPGLETAFRPTPCLLHTKALQDFRSVLESKTGIADEEMMVVALTGGLRIEQPFTKDRTAIVGALDRMEDDLSLWNGKFEHLTEEPLFTSLRTLVTVLRASPGPKAIVLVTAGVEVGDFHDPDFEELSAAANDAKVSFYPVDAFGVFVDTHSRFADPAALPEGAPGGPPALLRLASTTGGRLTSNTNDYTIGYARARRDLGCRYTIGFYDEHPELDKRHRVRIDSRRKGVQLSYADRFTFTSEKERWTQALEAAFLAPQPFVTEGLRTLLIARGGDGRVWRAGVQLRLPPSGNANTSTAIGASIVYRDKVTDQFSSSIASKGGVRPVVLEKSLDLEPGKFSVVAVAGDVGRGRVVSRRFDAVWPDPAQDRVAIAPIAALQSGSAAMSRDGVVGSSGSLAYDVDEPLNPAASITLETVVCRGAKTTAPIVVERWLEAALPNEFAPMTMGEAGDPCVQIVDVVKAGRLRQGVVDYRVVARIGDEIVAEERRALWVGGASQPR